MNAVKSQEARERTITVPVLAGALVAIAVLSLVLPYTGVRAMHARRLAAADGHARMMLAALSAPAVLPSRSSPDVLIGPGALPRFTDPAWSRASTVPLEPLVPAVRVEPDPWGNAYLVRIWRHDGHETMAVLSAGPDGIVQTPFDARTPSGDDRGIFP